MEYCGQEPIPKVIKSCNCSPGQVKVYLNKDQMKENDTIILLIRREVLPHFLKKKPTARQSNFNQITLAPLKI